MNLRKVFWSCLFFISSHVFAAASPEKTHIALDWTPNTNHTGLYVAKAEGFFAKQNIDAVFIQPTQSTATQLVGLGKAEFGISFMSDMFRARERGIPVRVIAAIIQNNTACFAWRKSAGITSIKSWEGKRYGGWGSPEEEATLKYIMTKNGADFSKLKIVTTGIGEFVPSTERNADFMWIYMGWSGIQATLAGIPFSTLCASDLDPVFNRPSPLIITSEALIKKNPKLVKSFLLAVSQGYKMAIESPKKAATDLLREVPELDAKLVEKSAEFLAPEYAKGAKYWGHLNPSKWREVGQWMVEQKLIKKPVSWDQYFTNDFLPHD